LLAAFYRHSLNVYTLTAATFALAAMCAALSWRFIERPALSLKGSKKAAVPQPVQVG
jgi:peptidoglycan/LPS O-acetylase OafA/YrhL